MANNQRRQNFMQYEARRIQSNTGGTKMGTAHSWREQAKCRDLPPDKADELFFFGSGGKSKKAKEFCLSCPVRRQCGDAGTLGHEEFGMWGAQKAEDLRLVGPDRFDKIQERHPEVLSSYLEYLPPRSEQSEVLDDEIEDNEIDEPENLAQILLSGDETLETG